MFDWFLAFNDAILSAEITQHWKRWEADNECKGFLDDNSMLPRIPWKDLDNLQNFGQNCEKLSLDSKRQPSDYKCYRYIKLIATCLSIIKFLNLISESRKTKSMKSHTRTTTCERTDMDVCVLLLVLKL
jgi:hypothetical protein